MANNAHLFSTDIEDFQLIKEAEKPYYFSRWNLPALWLLFFNENSIKLKNIYSDEEPLVEEDLCEELILFENKEIALGRFQQNLPLFSSIWKDIETDKTVLEFLEKIAGWKGKNLVLDTWSIIEDTTPKAFRDITQAFKTLSCGESQQFMRCLSDYTGHRNDKFRFFKEKVSDSPEGIIGYSTF
jgi:hypothetical protein